MEYKFESYEEYVDWLRSVVSKIYYSNMSMNDAGIRSAIAEIMQTLHTSENELLYDIDN